MYAYVYTECIQYVLVLPCVCSVKVCVCVGGGGGVCVNSLLLM